MRDWKNVCQQWLFPPLWCLVLLSVISTVGLVMVFLKGLETHPLAYGVYVLSFYTLCVLCLFFWKRFPGWLRERKARFAAHPYGHKYLTDLGYKVRVSLYLSLGLNLLYSTFKFLSGILYGSFWWGSVAVYYVILSVSRFLLLRYMLRVKDQPQNLSAEYRLYRLCGILMAVLVLTLSGVVLRMVRHNDAYVYPEVIVIASAVYTFYTVTMSIIDLVRYRKYHSPVMSAVKAIRFAAALVSLLSLETAMLVKYSGDERFRLLMTALTGAGIFLVIVSTSLYMVFNAQRQLNTLKQQNEI